MAHPRQVLHCSAEGKKTVLILMSDTGGGHRASAVALNDAFDQLYPGRIDTRIVDVFTEHCTAWPYSEFVGIYKVLANQPLLWAIIWYGSAIPLFKAVSDLFQYILCRQSFRDCLDKHDPHMVISVHPLVQDVTARLLDCPTTDPQSSAHGLAVPFATVVTDLGSAHPMWFHQKCDTCFVPTEVLRKVASAQGLADSQIKTVGLPVRAGFWDAPLPNKEQLHDSEAQVELRTKLGIDPTARTVLVVGGGDGVGGIEGIAKALALKLNRDGMNSGAMRQMVVVCGKNEGARRNLEALAGELEGGGAGLTMTCTGFVTNMDEWMSAADVLVTKAGPGTIAEAAIKGLPVMLSTFLPGQEAGNVDFVKESGFGDYSPDPEVIAARVSEWFGDPSALNSMRSAALASGRPAATLDVARNLGKTALESSATWMERRR